jgi:hypothetical protein
MLAVAGNAADLFIARPLMFVERQTWPARTP